MKLFFIWCLVFNSITLLSSEFTEALPSLQSEMIKIDLDNKDKALGKYQAIIDRLKGLKVNAENEEELMLFDSVMADVYSRNGDFDLSNQHWKKITEKVPHGEFYKKMVMNMLKKGDEDQAQAILSQFEEKVKTLPLDDEDKARQVQHVKNAFDEFKASAKKEADEKKMRKINEAT